jgi:hypothetical protein
MGENLLKENQLPYTSLFYCPITFSLLFLSLLFPVLRNRRAFSSLLFFFWFFFEFGGDDIMFNLWSQISARYPGPAYIPDTNDNFK